MSTFHEIEHITVTFYKNGKVSLNPQVTRFLSFILKLWVSYAGVTFIFWGCVLCDLRGLDKIDLDLERRPFDEVLIHYCSICTLWRRKNFNLHLSLREYMRRPEARARAMARGGEYWKFLQHAEFSGVTLEYSSKVHRPLYPWICENLPSFQVDINCLE